MLKGVEITVSNSLKANTGQPSPFICLKEVYEFTEEPEELGSLYVLKRIDDLRIVVNNYIAYEYERFTGRPLQSFEVPQSKAEVRGISHGGIQSPKKQEADINQISQELIPDFNANKKSSSSLFNNQYFE